MRGSVPRPGDTDLTKAVYAAKTKPKLCSSHHPNLPAVFLIEAFSLPAPPTTNSLKKKLTNMLCEISELITPNGVRICHWLFWGIAACVMEGNLLTNSGQFLGESVMFLWERGMGGLTKLLG